MSRAEGRTRVVPLDGPLDLALTLGPLRVGHGDPTWSIGDREAWHGLRTPAGPATVRLTHLGDAVSAECWGEGVDWCIDHAPRMVGVGDGRGQFDPVAGSALDRQSRRQPGHRMAASLDTFSRAVSAVLGQRVTATEAIRSWRQMADAWGEPAPGPVPDGLRLGPAPETLMATGYSAFHPMGVERGRADTIRSLARHGRRITDLADQPLDEASRVLRLMRGVGPWTESVVRQTALGDPDCVILGDLHIPGQVCMAILGTSGGDDEMLEALDRFRPLRGLAQRLAVSIGVGPQRRGPRYRPLPIARW